MKHVVIFSVLVVLVSACAPSKDQLKATLMENPDILFDVIEKNPAKFAEAAQKAAIEGRRVAAQKAEEEAKGQREEELKNPKQPEISENRAVRGKSDAAVTIVEYSDFQCPYCKRGYQTVEELRKKYGEKLRFVFKHLPLEFHPMAMPAAKRFEAIAIQSPEKAYKFHDEVFSHQEKLSSEGEKFLDSMAKKVGANMTKMKKDMSSEAVKSRIDADMAEAQKFGISGTPGFIVGGVTFRGAMPQSDFEEVIDRRLSENRKTASE